MKTFSSSHFSFLFGAFLSFCSSAIAQPQSLVDQFERRMHTSDSLTLPYRLFVPENYDSGTQYPLILTMHGSGERGIDNERHIASHRIATAWADPVNQSRWPAFVVSPQAPPRGTWAAEMSPVDTMLNPVSAEIYTVVSLLDSLAREFNIDPDRVYVTGISMGGFGVFDIAARVPERFAAAVPMSGGFTPNFINFYDAVPFWIFHGEVDATVPPEWSRQMVEAFIDIGREVMFTDCGLVQSDCSRISEAGFENGVESHVDVIYTGYPAGGHVIWEESYDDPRLAPWVFGQHRLVRDGILITSPADYPVWSGNQTVMWDVASAGETGELWYSGDNGESWTMVDSAVANTGSTGIDVTDVDDSPFARVRLVFLDSDGFVHRKEESGPFVVDGPADGPPFLRLDDRPFRDRQIVEEANIDLRILAGDPEAASLRTDVYFSVDGGTSFGMIESVDLTASVTWQSIDVSLGSLPNTNNAVLKVEITDGSSIVEARTSPFIKSTPREATDVVEHVQGEGVAEIQVNFVDPGELTGHRYRISFDGARPSADAFSVTDLQTGQIVLEDEPVSDGIRESRLFDGIRLIVAVSERATVDLDSTGWKSGDTNLEVTVSAPTINTPDGPVTLLATPADYVLTVTENVADTSSGELGFTERPMRFTVDKKTGERVDILFNDRNGDGWPSPQDFFYILEPSVGKLGTGSAASDLAWFVSFSGDASTILPSDGDVFEIRTMKPATESDVFEFDAVVGLASEADPTLPAAVSEVSNYPNPFSTSTTISYVLSETGNVTVTVFDMLGRIVDRIDLGIRPPGRQEWSWVPTGADDHQLPAGVYLYRIERAEHGTGGKSTATGRMTVVR